MKIARIVVSSLLVFTLVSAYPTKCCEDQTKTPLKEEISPQVSEITAEAKMPEIEPKTPEKEKEEPAAEKYSSLEYLEHVGTFTATAYCPCVECCGIWSAEHPSREDGFIQKTASGTTPKEGRTIAADWSILPKGSVVVIGGNPYTVEDTGSGIDGNRIDVFFDSHEDALLWGVQEVEVYKEKGN